MTSVISGSCKPPSQHPNMGDEDPSHRTFNRGFKVFGQAAAASKPTEGSLHNPAAFEDRKAFDRVGALDDRDGPVPKSGDGVAQLVSRIAAIGKDMAQPGIEGADGGEHLHRTVTVLDVGGMNAQSDQMALRISDDVALASLDRLAGIKAARAAAFRCLHRLAVDHPGRGARLPADPLARGGHKGMVDPLERAIP